MSGDKRDFVAEAAAVRAQAKAMHRRAIDTGQQAYAEMGGRRDDAAREAWAAREASKSANIQANREHNNAKDFTRRADEAAARAAEADADGRPADAEEARELAAYQRGLAVGATQRAERAHRAAMDQSARAEELDRTVADLESQMDAGPQRPPEAVADQLDDKARHLDDAAQAQQDIAWAEEMAAKYRAAGDEMAADHYTLEVDQHRQELSDALRRADAIQPALGDPSAAATPPSATTDSAATDSAATDSAATDSAATDSAATSAEAGTPAADTKGEATMGGDTKGFEETWSIDTDRDGLPDTFEAEIGTNPKDWDTDADGLRDGYEVVELRTDPLDADTDDDNLSDMAEDVLHTDPANADTDADGWKDGSEVGAGTDPRKAGPPEDREIAEIVERPWRRSEDADQDGIKDEAERAYGTDPNSFDTDGDGVGDLPELVRGTSPTNWDSDGDLRSDLEEVELGKPLPASERVKAEAGGPGVDIDAATVERVTTTTGGAADGVAPADVALGDDVTAEPALDALADAGAGDADPTVDAAAAPVLDEPEPVEVAVAADAGAADALDAGFVDESIEA